MNSFSEMIQLFKFNFIKSSIWQQLGNLWHNHLSLATICDIIFFKKRNFGNQHPNFSAFSVAEISCHEKKNDNFFKTDAKPGWVRGSLLFKFPWHKQ